MAGYMEGVRGGVMREDGLRGHSGRLQELRCPVLLSQSVLRRHLRNGPAYAGAARHRRAGPGERGRRLGRPAASGWAEGTRSVFKGVLDAI